jgi:osmotically-inducible protein OsmY
LAIAAITALGPTAAWGGDREIAQEIMTRLKSNRDSGALKDFTLDMKVDQGVVLFRGSVSETEQKDLVLAAAEGVEGVAKVVDQVTVKTAESAAKVLKAKAAEPTPAGGNAVRKAADSLRDMLTGKQQNEPATLGAMIEAGPTSTAGPEALAASEFEGDAPEPAASANPPMEIAPGEVRPTAAVEFASPGSTSDQQVVAGVVKALGQAQNEGRLRGFGVDVKSSEGIVSLRGRAASAEQRDQIIDITRSVPGVEGVQDAISVLGQPAPAGQANVPAQLASNRMEPVKVDQVPTMAAPLPQQMRRPAPVTRAGVPAIGAAAAGGQAAHAPAAGTPVMGTPVQPAPVPMNRGVGVGAPRYDAPNLPGYAWPGYAAHPNYAALTYPQQYSPSAWPYIGPFYPYPQVPLGWRKVSLEWDDGWWFLDFTDR